MIDLSRDSHGGWLTRSAVAVALGVLLIGVLGLFAPAGSAAVPRAVSVTAPADPELPVSDYDDGCAPFKKFSDIGSHHLECQHVQILLDKWGRTGKCKPVKGKNAATCKVYDFTCKSKRRGSSNGLRVGCGLPATGQRVTFKFR